mmetsp:Transcript_18177/g.42085  ORF Transcript_18177/g.42085 Transcript_18177/m.42085 type:complete len:97 (+) Transcript_18177:737-1027(+)
MSQARCFFSFFSIPMPPSRGLRRTSLRADHTSHTEHNRYSDRYDLLQTCNVTTRERRDRQKLKIPPTSDDDPYRCKTCHRTSPLEADNFPTYLEYT